MTLLQENGSPFLTTQFFLSYNRKLLFSRVGSIDLVKFISCCTHKSSKGQGHTRCADYQCFLET